jgi:nucleoside-diphosphate-sugar epimerase
MSEKHVVLGTGAIGRAIMEELVKRGASVSMVNRSGKLDEAPAEVEVVSADLYDPESVRQVTHGAKVVYQSAQPHYHEWPEKFSPLQKSIIQGLIGSGAKRVIVENTYMYGDLNGAPMTEDTPHNPHTRKGRVRSELSKAALAAHQAGNVRVAIGRGSDFFGPWGLQQTTMGARAFYPILNGKAAQLVGRVDVPHTHTFTRDFGRALVILGERSQADGQIWHVPNDMPRITQGDLIAIFAEEASMPARISRVGKLGWQVIGLFIPEAKEFVEMMYEFDQPFIIDSSKFEKAFGMKATPMREAIKETVYWFKSHPKKK